MGHLRRKRSMPMLKRLTALHWLLIVLGGLCLVSMFNHGPVPSMEPRFAESVREMLARHQYLIPIKNGVPYIEYPPLYFWLSLAASLVRPAPGSGHHLRARLRRVSAVGVLALTAAERALPQLAQVAAAPHRRGLAGGHLQLLHGPVGLAPAFFFFFGGGTVLTYGWKTGIGPWAAATIQVVRHGITHGLAHCLRTKGGTTDGGGGGGGGGGG